MAWEEDASVQGREKQSTHLESFLKTFSPMTFFILLPGYWQIGFASENVGPSFKENCSVYEAWKSKRN